MKLTVKARDLKAAMKKASPLFSKPTTVTVAEFSNVLITVTKTGFELYGNNASMGITVTHKAGVSVVHENTSGKAIVRWADLKNAVGTFKAKETLTILTHMGNLQITNGVAEIGIALQKEAPPESRLTKGGISFKADLKPVIAKCLPFASTELERLVFNGCAIQGKGVYADVVACDDRRLKVTPVTTTETVPFEAVIPTEACLVIERYFPDAPIAVSLSSTKNKIDLACFKAGDMILTTMLIDGEYPDWQCVVEDVEDDLQFTVNRQEAIDALTPFGKLKRPRGYSAIPVQWKTIGEMLSMWAGSMACAIGADSNVDSDPLIVNAKFMLSCLLSIDSERITVKTEGRERAMLIQGDNEEEYTLMMPMKDIDMEAVYND